jgi:uncharacterized protein YbjT (DUF2867 family)
MSRPKILVTGATGRTGGVVVSELLRAGYPVRAMVRRDDVRAAGLRAQGVEVAVAEITDAERVADAMRGVQRAYWLPPYDPEMLTGAMVFAAAARATRLESIVTLSQWLASPSHPAFLTRHHWIADQVFDALPNISLTRVTPGLFADSPYLETIGMAAHMGLMPWMFGESRTAPPSVDDIGRVVCAALLSPERHDRQVYRPTGPAVLSGPDMAGILSRVFNCTVRPIPTPLWLFLKVAHRSRQPLALLSCVEYYAEEHRRGIFEIGAPNDVVAHVTGRPAEAFETVARRHAARPENQGSSARWREIARFLSAPLVRAPNLAGYRRGLRLHEPVTAQYANESMVWRHEHVSEGHVLDPMAKTTSLLSPA